MRLDPGVAVWLDLLTRREGAMRPPFPLCIREVRGLSLAHSQCNLANAPGAITDTRFIQVNSGAR
jgi:hypothetical protein